MENYGLLSGLAAGLKGGLEGYNTERDYQLKKQNQAAEDALKKKMYHLSLQEKGLQEKEGSFVKTADAISKDDLQRRLTESQIFKNEREPAENPLSHAIQLMNLQKGSADLQDRQKKAADPFNQLPKMQQMEAEGLLKQSQAKNKGLLSLNAAIDQLNDPKKSDDEKVMIGQMVLKLLNDPENSDAVGAEEVRRLGGYLERFSIQRPGLNPIGRNLEEFTKQTKNKRDLIQQTKQKTDSQLQNMGLIQGAQKKEDLEAIDWARKNPTDPRAVKILQHNGVQ